MYPTTKEIVFVKKKVDYCILSDCCLTFHQNLRDALDNMFDARIPALWRKVNTIFRDHNTEY